jgi:hypothetical protein
MLALEVSDTEGSAVLEDSEVLEDSAEWEDWVLSGL